MNPIQSFDNWETKHASFNTGFGPSWHSFYTPPEYEDEYYYRQGVTFKQDGLSILVVPNGSGWIARSDVVLETREESYHGKVCGTPVEAAKSCLKELKPILKSINEPRKKEYQINLPRINE